MDGAEVEIEDDLFFFFFDGRTSLQFSLSLMSDSLRPHGLQHTRLPCPSPTPEACWNSCPSSQWRHPTFSSSDVPFTSCLQSFPASGTFPMSQFFTSYGLSLDMFTPEGVSRGGRDGRWGWAVNYHLGGPKMMCGRSGIQTQVGAIMFRQERILLITIGGKESWGSSHVIVSSLCGWRWDDLQGMRRLRGDCRCEEWEPVSAGTAQCGGASSRESLWGSSQLCSEAQVQAEGRWMVEYVQN